MKRTLAIGALLLAALPLCLTAQHRAAGGAGSAPGPLDLQEEGDEQDEYVPPRCTTCKSTGLLVCKEHVRRDCDLEHNALYCSLFDGCEACLGAGWLDCPECEHEEAEGWIELRTTRQAEARERWTKEIDEELGLEPLTLQSEHFLLVWELEDLKIDKKRRSQHEAAHIYLDRFETLFDDYCQALVASDEDFSSVVRILIWGRPEDQEKASKTLCGTESDQDVKLMGGEPIYTLCGTKKYYRDDEELHRTLVHNTVHLLLSLQSPSMWIGDRRGGWADAGLAHWFEDRYFQICDNYCDQGFIVDRDFKGGKWRPAVRKMVSRDEVDSIDDVFQRNTDTLTQEMHAVSFSYVDYLLVHDGEQANRLFRRLRARTSTRDALRETFAKSPEEFEEAWKEWVLATYPTR